MSKPVVQLASYIDHTLLKMDATQNKIQILCQEALKYHFCAVCVNSVYVPFVKTLLANSSVKVCSVIGFPLGASLTSVKVFETKAAIEAGADEIDMVINIGLLKSDNIAAFMDDIRQVKLACGSKILKVILETCLLTSEQIKHICLICRDLNVDFVKTSTGFSSGGATLDDVRLIRETVGDKIGVKASGGIRDRATALAMIDAGATRLGCSAGVVIVAGETSESGY